MVELSSQGNWNPLSIQNFLLYLPTNIWLTWNPSIQAKWLATASCWDDMSPSVYMPLVSSGRFLLICIQIGRYQIDHCQVQYLHCVLKNRFQLNNAKIKCWWLFFGNVYLNVYQEVISENENLKIWIHMTIWMSNSIDVFLVLKRSFQLYNFYREKSIYGYIREIKLLLLCNSSRQIRYIEVLLPFVFDVSPGCRWGKLANTSLN